MNIFVTKLFVPGLLIVTLEPLMTLKARLVENVQIVSPLPALSIVKGLATTGA
jgi:hypothetical protein